MNKQTLEVIESKSFDTSDDFFSNDKLIAFIDTLADGDLVFSGIKGDGAFNLSP